MARRGKLLIGALFVALPLILTACGSSENSGSDDEIVIGAAVSESGFLEPFDVPPLEALKIRIDEINAKGGIDGKKVRIITRDTKSEIPQARNAAQALVDDGAEIILAPADFDYGSPAALVAQENGLVSFSLGAQSPKFGVQGVGPLAYTTALATYAEGALLADFSRAEGWDAAHLLVDDTNSYSREVCEGFGKRFTDRGGTVAGTELFKQDDESVASQLSTIEQSNFDVLMLCSLTPGGFRALRQIRSAGIDQPVLGTGSLDGSYWTDAVPNLKDFYVAAPISIYGDDPDPEANRLVKEYEETVGEPMPVGVNVNGYSIAEALIVAIREAGTTDGEELAAALDEFRDEPLLIGPTTFTPEQHIATDRLVRIIRYTNGKPAYHKTQEPAEAIELSDFVGG